MIIYFRSQPYFFFKTNVLSILSPINLLKLFSFSWKNIRFHSSGKETFIFLKVTNIDFIFEKSFPPLYLEIEPLKMASSIAIHPHKAIILPLPDLHDTIEIATLEERVKDEIIFSLPMLSTERSIGKLHIIWCFNVAIWKFKTFIIPSIICILIARTEIAYFNFLFRMFEHTFDEMIISLILEDDGYGSGHIIFKLPSICYNVYPVSISGRKEYDLSVIYWGGGILNLTYSLWLC